MSQQLGGTGNKHFTETSGPMNISGLILRAIDDDDDREGGRPVDQPVIGHRGGSSPNLPNLMLQN